MPQDETPPHAKLDALRDRLLLDGLNGAPFEALLAAFGTGLNEAGIAATRIHVTMRTNNPAFGSIAHRWLREEGTHLESFPRRESHSENWLQSPLLYLLTIEDDELRQRLDDPNPTHDFQVFDDFRARKRKFLSQKRAQVFADIRHMLEAIVTAHIDPVP